MPDTDTDPKYSVDYWTERFHDVGKEAHTYGVKSITCIGHMTDPIEMSEIYDYTASCTFSEAFGLMQITKSNMMAAMQDADEEESD